MKKFLSKFAAVAAGFAATHADAAAIPTVIGAQDSSIVAANTYIVPPVPTRDFSTAEDRDFVIQRLNDQGQLTQYHYSHASHASHRSHASHYSSRY